jgi:hypothetical protein
MAHVIVEIEVWIVDPDRMIEERDLMKSLTISRDEMQIALGGAFDQIDIDSAALGLKGTDVEYVGRGDMHPHVALFEKKK